LLIFSINNQVSFIDYITATFAVADKHPDIPTVLKFAEKMLEYNNTNPDCRQKTMVVLDCAAMDQDYFTYPYSIHNVIDNGKVLVRDRNGILNIPQKQIELWQDAFPLSESCYNRIAEAVFSASCKFSTFGSLKRIFNGTHYDPNRLLYLSHIANVIMAEKNAVRCSGEIEANMMKLSKAIQKYNDCLIEYAKTKVPSISVIASQVMSSMISSSSIPEAQSITIPADDDIFTEDMPSLTATPAVETVTVSSSTIPSSAPAPVPVVQITMEAAQFRGCKICEERSIEVVFMPCRHNYCKKCVNYDDEEKRPKICHECRQNIDVMIDLRD